MINNKSISINSSLSEVDSDIESLINKELNRQIEHIELIASENYVSRAVLEAQGSILTNKYAEGYPSRRYYGGCDYVDEIESIAIERACNLFKAEYANVQPHSGSQANQAVYFALLKPNDTVLGLSLNEGGHLTHGSKVNLSGKLFNFVSYGLNEEEEIDYNQVEDLAKEHKPRLIIAGASAYALEIDFKKFREIANMVGAILMVDMAHYAGLIAAGLYPNPVPYADIVTSTTHKTLRGPRGGLILAKNDYAKLLNSSIFPGIQGGPLEHIIAAKAVAFKEAASLEFKSYQLQVKKNAKVLGETLIQRGLRLVGGTTQSHMVLVDLRSKEITGNIAENILGLSNITANKNSIPHDPQKPTITSGIRFGTPAITTRGFKELECEKVAHMIADVLENPDNLELRTNILQEVIELTRQFPIY